MSSIYISEPPTTAKVLIKTSRGEIDVELWCKECPLACRNFLQLCVDGYYNGIIFHRVEKGFIVQTGDPTGTGTGGESIYDGGKPFKTETHKRLKFNRRGLVGMASAGISDNTSQFFITLDRADELNKKHTLFGKITGNTIFNVLTIGDVQVDENKRPLDPPRIIGTEILSNFYDDMVPRELQRADTPSEQPTKKEKKKKKGTKNFSLMSFGEEAEAAEEEDTGKGKVKSSHDVLQGVDPSLKAEPAVDDAAEALEAFHQKQEEREEKRKRKKMHEEKEAEDRLSGVREEARQLEEELRQAKRSRKDKDAKEEAKRNSAAAQFLSAQREQFTTAKDLKRKRNRQEDTLAMLASFRSKLKQSSSFGEDEEDTGTPAPEHGEEDGGSRAGAERGWLHHEFRNEDGDTGKGIDPALDPNTLDLYDPRNPLNVRRREEAKKKHKKSHRRR